MSGVPANVLDVSMCVVGFGVSDEHFIYSTFHDLVIAKNTNVSSFL